MKARLVGLAVVVLALTAGGTWLSAADFDGNSRSDVAIFRGSSSLWSVQGITKFYFGQTNDVIVPGDYDGNGVDEGAIFRPVSNLWSVRDLTKTYLGTAGDIPITGGGGQRTFDYVVKAGNGADLVAALQSNTFDSVFIPDGTYNVSEVINVNSVHRIEGESTRGTIIHFMADDYLLVDQDYCHIGNIQFEHANADPYAGALVFINAGVDWVTVQNCRFDGNNNVLYGLEYTSTSHWVQVLNCYANECTVGFQGDIDAVAGVFSNCQTRNCITGFDGIENISSSEVEGLGAGYTGYSGCRRLVACKTRMVQVGFNDCLYLSACTADSNGVGSTAGFRDCSYISSCAAGNATWGFQSCTHISSSEAMSCTASWSGCSYICPESTSTSP